MVFLFLPLDIIDFVVVMILRKYFAFCSVPEITHTLAKANAQKQKTTRKQQNKKLPTKLNPPAGKLLQTSQLCFTLFLTLLQLSA